MNWRETSRYAALGAAAALVLSGGLYATTSFARPPIDAVARGIYSGDFDYVPKAAQGEQPAEKGDATVTVVPAGQDPRPETQAPPSTSTPEAADQGAPANDAALQSAPNDGDSGPAPAAQADGEPVGDEPAPAEPPGEGDEPVDEPGQEPAADGEGDDPQPEPADPPADDGAGEDPEEPGRPLIPPGPGTIKALNPCLLIDCDPDPAIGIVKTVDICKLLDCPGPDPVPMPKPSLIEVIAPRH